MKRMHFFTGLAIWCAALAVARGEPAVPDPGKEVIGAVTVTVYHATNGDPTVAGGKAKEADKATVDKLRKDPHLKFAHYRVMGTDRKPLFRSYENWAQPFGTSDELLVRFETQSRPTKDSIRLDLELWLGRKKVLKTAVLMTAARPVHVLGPEWRGGRMIISVGLAPGGTTGASSAP